MTWTSYFDHNELVAESFELCVAAFGAVRKPAAMVELPDVLLVDAFDLPQVSVEVFLTGVLVVVR